MWWILVGCGPAPTPCGAAECAEVCAATARPSGPVVGEAPVPPIAPAGHSVSDFEQGLVGPVLEDIRAGVRPWSDEAVGICSGKRDCAAFLGADPGELPPGDYNVKAELRVPAAGEKGTWKVKFASECLVERPGTEPTRSEYAREYDVWYAGPERGYRLMPLRSFESPSKEGPQRCTWTLTAPHPDGDQVMKGSWSVPGR